MSVTVSLLLELMIACFQQFLAQLGSGLPGAEDHLDYYRQLVVAPTEPADRGAGPGRGAGTPRRPLGPARRPLGRREDPLRRQAGATNRHNPGRHPGKVWLLLVASFCRLGLPSACRIP